MHEKDDLEKFQHTAARRRLGAVFCANPCHMAFQHTAARRRLGFHRLFCKHLKQFQHTAARRRLVLSFQDNNNNKSFNTQPPEGGWIFQRVLFFRTAVSTHSRPKAAGAFIDQISFSFHVSTHSRPKAAGSTAQPQGCNKDCFNTQPPEGGWFSIAKIASRRSRVSTHSRPKAAGMLFAGTPTLQAVSTHSRPKAAGSS